VICEHLRDVEAAVVATGARETSRGQAWTDNCREWVYFDTHLDIAGLRATLDLDACVVEHENTDPRSGTERGLVCTVHHDGVMGLL
jgi:hypothetical protein